MTKEPNLTTHVMYTHGTIPQAWGHPDKEVWMARLGTKTYQATSLTMLQELVSNLMEQYKISVGNSI